MLLSEVVRGQRSRGRGDRRRVERDLGAAVSIIGGFEVRSMRGKQGEHVRHAATANLEMLVMKSRGGAGMEVETG
jgi:hypothetical protein